MRSRDQTIPSPAALKPKPTTCRRLHIRRHVVGLDFHSGSQALLGNPLSRSSRFAEHSSHETHRTSLQVTTSNRLSHSSTLGPGSVCHPQRSEGSRNPRDSSLRSESQNQLTRYPTLRLFNSSTLSLLNFPPQSAEFLSENIRATPRQVGTVEWFGSNPSISLSPQPLTSSGTVPTIPLHTHNNPSISSPTCLTKSRRSGCACAVKGFETSVGVSPTRKLFAPSGSSRGGEGGNEFAEALRCQRAARRFSELAGRNVQ